MGILGCIAIVTGAVATWMLIEVFKRSTRPGAETFGAELVILPCFLAAVAYCFRVAWLCFYGPNKLPSQFSLGIMLVVVTLIAVSIGLVAWLGS
jgi:hypothetical protein